MNAVKKHRTALGLKSVHCRIVGIAGGLGEMSPPTGRTPPRASGRFARRDGPELTGGPRRKRNLGLRRPVQAPVFSQCIVDRDDAPPYATAIEGPAGAFAPARPRGGPAGAPAPIGRPPGPAGHHAPSVHPPEGLLPDESGRALRVRPRPSPRPDGSRQADAPVLLRPVHERPPGRPVGEVGARPVEPPPLSVRRPDAAPRPAAGRPLSPACGHRRLSSSTTAAPSAPGLNFGAHSTLRHSSSRGQYLPCGESCLRPTRGGLLYVCDV